MNGAERKNSRGQGMVEYVLIVALIALIVLAGVKLFGGKVKDLFSSAADKVATEGQRGLSSR
jgi:Flp pilus assembly pilin Flp